MVHYYSIDESINQFEIGYTIKPSLQFNKVFIEQVIKYLIDTFHENTMEIIKDFLRNNNTCVVALIMIYDMNRVKQKVCRVLSCVLRSLIYNYVCIDFLLC